MGGDGALVSGAKMSPNALPAHHKVISRMLNILLNVVAGGQNITLGKAIV